MHPKEPPAPSPEAIDALVEAERAWSAHLEAVRADAARLLAAAQAEAEGATAALNDELASVVERHRRELDARLAVDVVEIARRGQAAADRYTSISEETVRVLAGEIVRRVPWLAAAPPPEPPR